MVAYGSLVVMALLPIFIGSYRSVSSHRLVFIGSYGSLVVMALLPIALAPTAPLAPTGYFLSTPSPLSAPTG